MVYAINATPTEQSHLDEAGIPALSRCWVKEGKKQTLACGVTDTSNPTPVSSSTVFQAASLSKPVSAAIVLDLLEQIGWDLKLPLADFEAFCQRTYEEGKAYVGKALC